MGNEPPIKPLIDIPRMADKASLMLRRSLDALVNRDIVAAAGVRADDDEVDALYDQIYRELLTFMLEDPRTITTGHVPAMGRARPRTHRRPGDQHRQARHLPRHRPACRDQEPRVDGLIVLSQLEYDELADAALSPLPSWERACPVLDTGARACQNPTYSPDTAWVPRANRSTRIMLTWYQSHENRSLP